VVQITGVAQIPLADADFILDPKSVVPVAVDLIRPERAGLGKFVGGGVGVGGVAKLGKGVGKAGLSGMWQLVALLSNRCCSWWRLTSRKVPLGPCCLVKGCCAPDGTSPASKALCVGNAMVAKDVLQKFVACLCQ